MFMLRDCASSCATHTGGDSTDGPAESSPEPLPRAAAAEARDEWEAERGRLQEAHRMELEEAERREQHLQERLDAANSRVRDSRSRYETCKAECKDRPQAPAPPEVSRGEIDQRCSQKLEDLVRRHRSELLSALEKAKMRQDQVQKKLSEALRRAEAAERRLATEETEVSRRAELKAAEIVRAADDRAQQFADETATVERDRLALQRQCVDQVGSLRRQAEESALKADAAEAQAAAASSRAAAADARAVASSSKAAEAEARAQALEALRLSSSQVRQGHAAVGVGGAHSHEALLATDAASKGLLLEALCALTVYSFSLLRNAVFAAAQSVSLGHAFERAEAWVTDLLDSVGPLAKQAAFHLYSTSCRGRLESCRSASRGVAEVLKRRSGGFDLALKRLLATQPEHETWLPQAVPREVVAEDGEVTLESPARVLRDWALVVTWLSFFTYLVLWKLWWLGIVKRLLTLVAVLRPAARSEGAVHEGPETAPDTVEHSSFEDASSE